MLRFVSVSVCLVVLALTTALPGHAHCPCWTEQQFQDALHSGFSFQGGFTQCSVADTNIYPSITYELSQNPTGDPRFRFRAAAAGCEYRASPTFGTPLVRNGLTVDIYWDCLRDVTTLYNTLGGAMPATCDLDFCGTTAANAQQLSPDPCLNGGNCTSLNAAGVGTNVASVDFECACPPAFPSGKTCCPVGFCGSRCDEQVVDACTSLPCQNGGTCSLIDVGTPFCTCPAGWKGPTCETQLCPCWTEAQFQFGLTNPLNLPVASGTECSLAVGTFADLFMALGSGLSEVVFRSSFNFGPALTTSCTYDEGGVSRSVDLTGSPLFISLCISDVANIIHANDPPCNASCSQPCQNGGTCDFTTDGCFCPPGFTGAQCETSLTACDSSPCQNGGTCSIDGAGFSCACAPGYCGSECEEAVNACDTAPCQNGGTCTSTGPGIFSCACVAGFVGDDCSVEPCNPNPCQNGGTCTVDGGVPEGFTCDCASGFVGALCDLEPCNPNPCKNGGTCTVDGGVPEGFTCDCASGFVGALCDLEPCNPNPCKNGGTCTVDGGVPEGFTCTCTGGFIGALCDVPPPTTDPILSLSCNELFFEAQVGTNPLDQHVQISNLGGGTVVLDSVTNVEGWLSTTAPGSVPGQLVITVTSSGLVVGTYTDTIIVTAQSPSQNSPQQVAVTLEVVPVPPTACDTSPCENSGTCTLDGGEPTGFTCICASEWIGGLCDVPIVVQPDPCDTSPCVNGGICFDLGMGTFACDCTSTGYMGGRCNQPLPNDACIPDPCNGNGVCVPETVGFTCVCNAEFEGILCDTPIPLPCAASPCSNGATCINTSPETFTCTCPVSGLGGLPLFEGPLCDTARCPCWSQTNLDDALTSGLTLTSSQCPTGFGLGNAIFGTAPGDTIRFDVSTNPLCTYETVVGGMTTLVVATMESSETQCNVDVASLLVASGEPCDIDSCLVSPCKNGGSCTDGAETFTCACVPGFIGATCEINVDDCTPNPCANGGVCNDGVASFTCTCAPGWTGTTCTVVVDPCVPDPCNGGSCAQGTLPWTFACTNCPTGFCGIQCEELVNACEVNPCQNGGTCTSTGPGTFSCSCASGFVGALCDIEPCNPNPCQHGGTCVADAGVPEGFTCSCASGFIGALCDVPFVPPPQNFCSSSPCANGGTCVECDGTFQCECTTNFTGPVCEEVACPCWSESDLQIALDGNFDVNAALCPTRVVFLENATAQYLFRSPQVSTPDGTNCVFGNFADSVPVFTVDPISQAQFDQCQLDIVNLVSLSGEACVCDPGFGGTLCRDPIDACESSPCQNGAACNSTGPGTFTCGCTAGFTGALCDVPVVVQPDPCDASPCQNGGSCTFQPSTGTFTCDCAVGFTSTLCELFDCGTIACDVSDLCNPQVCDPLTGTCNVESVDYNDGIACNGVETCDPGTGLEIPGVDPCTSPPNTASCEEIIGNDGFTCTCAAGYTGQFCQSELNGCASTPCVHGGVCTDTGLGTFTCDCTGTGFDGAQCENNINECLVAPCLNGVCVDGIGTYTCDCNAGFTGTDCQTNIDECSSSPCFNGGVCLDGTASFLCNCDATAFTGTLCEIPDTCSPDLCSGPGTQQCIATSGGNVCVCLPGFSGALCDVEDVCFGVQCCNGGSCTAGICTGCDAGWEGPTCETQTDNCAPNPCVNGVCSNLVGDYVCTCTPGWTGTNCDQNIDNCVPAPSGPCFNGGLCSDGVDSFSCDCTGTGFTGSQCEMQINDCAVAPAPCGSNGLCIDEINGFTCVCGAGFEGTDCSQNINECLGNPCGANGVCNDGINSFTCTCMGGFTGALCDCPPLVPENPCDPDPCNGGTCTSNAMTGGFTCSACPTGFEGDVCDCPIAPPDDPCDPNPCVNGGTCVPNGASFTCTCPVGFTGPQCETTIVPPENACDPNPCVNGACVLDSNDLGFTCTCTGGFTGGLCDCPPVVPDDPCDPTPCVNGGTCVPNGASFTCTCPVGFTGPQCETTIVPPENACDPDPCRNDGLCIPNAQTGGFTCDCDGTGFVGTVCDCEPQTICNPNPCVNGVCHEGAASFTCTCFPGFTGPLCDIPVVDACSPNPCQNGGTCVDDQGLAVCTCAPEWTGTLCQIAVNDTIPPASPCTDGEFARREKCWQKLQVCDHPEGSETVPVYAQDIDVQWGYNNDDDDDDDKCKRMRYSKHCQVPDPENDPKDTIFGDMRDKAFALVSDIFDSVDDMMRSLRPRAWGNDRKRAERAIATLALNLAGGACGDTLCQLVPENRLVPGNVQCNGLETVEDAFAYVKVQYDQGYFENAHVCADAINDGVILEDLESTAAVAIEAATHMGFVHESQVESVTMENVWRTEPMLAGGALGGLVFSLIAIWAFRRRYKLRLCWERRRRRGSMMAMLFGQPQHTRPHSSSMSEERERSMEMEDET